jgi:hypothetical protein
MSRYEQNATAVPTELEENELTDNVSGKDIPSQKSQEQSPTGSPEAA